MKSKMVALWAFLVAAVVLANIPSAMAVPVSIDPIVDDAVAQTSLTITEVMPFVAAVIGGIVLFKLVRRFVK